MLETTRQEHDINTDLREREQPEELHLDNLRQSEVASTEFENNVHNLWDMPFPPETPSEGQSMVGAQLNVNKLMSFLNMPTTTTMLVRLKGDPELAETLRSFLNDELAVHLHNLQEAPIQNSAHMLEQTPKVVPNIETLNEDDPKSLFKLRVNTLGDYFEGDDSNAVLPIVCKGNTIMAILDGGAGVSIITKRCWEKMGRPPMEEANFKVKLANGSLIKALGVLTNFKIKVLDQYVYHTFAIMDFNDKPCSYEMILGRPFMREYNMIHDWSQNQVYLTLQDETICVDLKTGKSRPMTHKFFQEKPGPTVFSYSEPNTSVNYCKGFQKEIGPEINHYTSNQEPIHDVDWSHLLATMDVWGKRGITCVKADGTPLPQYVPLCTISVVGPKDTCDTQLREGKVMYTKAKQNDADRDLAEPFHICLDLHTLKNKITETALIDSGADTNILSYEVWEALGKPRLIPTTICIQSFSKITTPSLGTIFLKMSIQNQPLYDLFYVANKDQAMERVVLGRLWMYLTDCKLDWRTRRFTIEVKSSTLTGEIHNPKGQPIKSTPIEQQNKPRTTPNQPRRWTQNVVSQEGQDGCVKGSCLKSQSYNKGERNIWLPKATKMSNPRLAQRSVTQEPPPPPGIEMKSKPSTQRWLPITLLKAKGYYQGVTQLWLPKKRSPATMKELIQDTQPSQCSSIKHKWIGKANSKKNRQISKKNPMRKTMAPSTTARWVPKAILQAQRYYEGNYCIWIPKISLSTTPAPRTYRSTTRLGKDTRSFSSDKVSRSPLQEQINHKGNPRIWLPKHTLHKKQALLAMEGEAISTHAKGKQVAHELPLTPTAKPILAAHSTYEQGESSCTSMAELSRSSSLSSSKYPYAKIVNPHASTIQIEANISKVLPLDQTYKSAEDAEIMPTSKDFDVVVHQVNQAKDFLEHKFKASANWFTAWKLPVLQNILSSHQLQEV